MINYKACLLHLLKHVKTKATISDYSTHFTHCSTDTEVLCCRRMLSLLAWLVSSFPGCDVVWVLTTMEMLSAAGDQRWRLEMDRDIGQTRPNTYTDCCLQSGETGAVLSQAKGNQWSWSRWHRRWSMVYTDNDNNDKNPPLALSALINHSNGQLKCKFESVKRPPCQHSLLHLRGNIRLFWWVDLLIGIILRQYQV